MDPFHDKLIGQAPRINMYWGSGDGGSSGRLRAHYIRIVI